MPRNTPAPGPLHTLFSLPGKLLCHHACSIHPCFILPLLKCCLLREALTTSPIGQPHQRLPFLGWPAHPSLPKAIPVLKLKIPFIGNCLQFSAKWNSCSTSSPHHCSHRTLLCSYHITYSYLLFVLFLLSQSIPWGHGVLFTAVFLAPRTVPGTQLAFNSDCLAKISKEQPSWFI